MRPALSCFRLGAARKVTNSDTRWPLMRQASRGVFYDKKVAEILANLPGCVNGPLITEEIRCVFLQFSAAWPLLGSQARLKVLPDVNT
jgi:hypothetical protein